MVHDMETASADSAVIWLHDSQNQGYGHSGVNGISAFFHHFQACGGSIRVIAAHRSLRPGGMGLVHCNFGNFLSKIWSVWHTILSFYIRLSPYLLSM